MKKINQKDKKVLVILGPTSSGKTFLALKISENIKNSVIISADSRQIYKYMDIGTGKVPINSKIEIEKRDDHWKLNNTTVFGYDLVRPGDYFSAYDFMRYARLKISTNETPILVGGTGFYIDYTCGLIDVHNYYPNLEKRAELESLTLDKLVEKLYEQAPNAAKSIDLRNKVRIIRALEKAGLTPTPIERPSFIPLFVGISFERADLYARSDKWVEEIWQTGLVEETRNLIDMGFEESKQLNGIIYKTVKRYIFDEISQEEAKKLIKFEIHAYIRRQETWFKRNKLIKWYSPKELENSNTLNDLVK